MRVNQEHEAQQFEQAHLDLLPQIKHGLMNRAIKLFSENEANVPQKEREAFHRFADANNLDDAFRVIRSQAVAVCQTNDTAPYWQLIDAMGFYLDATATQWPYMTQQGRYRSLIWSLEYLQGRATSLTA